MAKEIERKFLVKDDSWHALVTETHHIRQGYLAHTNNATVRVRLLNDTEACLTVKGRTSGISRDEFEYPIPVEDARDMLALCLGNVIEKRRHIIPNGDLQWEVDVFEADHTGLIIAEIELLSEDQDFNRPDWLGEEVSDSPRYFNVNLADIRE